MPRAVSVPPARLGPPARGAAACLALVVAGLLAGCGSGPVEIDEPDLGEEAAATCRELVEDLPDTVADQRSRPVTPDGAAGAAWGDPAIVLTCGVGEPEGYVPEGPCTVVDGVGWYVPEEQLDANGAVDLTMTTLFRQVDVEVVLPKEYWPPATALADLSTVVAAHTEAEEKCL